MTVARRLGEALIEESAAAARDVRDDAVEGLPVLLIAIEAEVQVGAEEAPALRHAERQRPVDRAGWNRQRVGRSVFQHRDDVADGGRPEAGHRRILGGVYDLVDLVRL